MGHSFPGLVDPGEARHGTVQCSFPALISRACLLWKRGCSFPSLAPQDLSVPGEASNE